MLLKSLLELSWASFARFSSLARSDACAHLLLGVPVIYAGLLCYAGPQIAEQTSDGFNVDAHISMVGLIGMGNLCFLASTVILTWVVNREAKLLLAQATENPPPDEAEAR